MHPHVTMQFIKITCHVYRFASLDDVLPLSVKALLIVNRLLNYLCKNTHVIFKQFLGFAQNIGSNAIMNVVRNFCA